MKAPIGVRSVRAHRAAVVGLLGLTSVSFAPRANAVPPITSTDSFDFTVRTTRTSEACGFDVYRRLAGTVTIRLHLNQAGLVVAEEDLSNDTITTWFAPSRGSSFSYRSAGSTQWDYPGGATLGSPATAKITGKSLKVPGQHAGAGMTIYVGTVEAFSPEGVPLVVVGDVVKDVGSPIISAKEVCAALA
jgi:hypothetical protein